MVMDPNAFDAGDVAEQVARTAHDERSARVLLSLVTTPDDPRTAHLVARLVAQHGARASATMIAGDRPRDGIGAAEWDWLRHQVAEPLSRIQVHVAATAALTAPGTKVLIPGDAAWPTAIDDLGPRTPLALWARGSLVPVTQRAARRVALAGAFAPRQNGRALARWLAAGLAERGLQVITSAGGGIGAEARSGAARIGGQQIVVTPAWPEPASKPGELDLIVEQGGGVLSEAPPSVPTSRARAIAAGRIVAALAHATVQIEAADLPSAVHVSAWQVAQNALELDRPIGAVVGRADPDAVLGPHALIDQGAAKIITPAHIAQLLYRVPRPGRTSPSATRRDLASPRTGPGRRTGGPAGPTM